MRWLVSHGGGISTLCDITKAQSQHGLFWPVFVFFKTRVEELKPKPDFSDRQEASGGGLIGNSGEVGGTRGL